MKIRLLVWTLSLIAALFASSCAPAISTLPSLPIETLVPSTTPRTIASAPQGTAAAARATLDVEVVATSRGPDLEATDPETVKLASGQLQLIEFFRFT